MSRFRRMTFCSKMTASFAAVLGLTLALSVGSLIAIRSLGHSLESAVNAAARKMNLAAATRSGVAEMRVHAALAEISLLDTKLADGSMGAGTVTACASCHTQERVTANRASFTASGTDLIKVAAALRGLSLNSTESQALDVLVSGVNDWTSLYGRYLDLAQEKDFSQAHDIMVDRIYPLIARLEQAAASLEEEQHKALQADRAESGREVSTSLWRISLTVILAFIAGLGGLLVVRQVGAALRLRAVGLLDMSRQVAATAAQISESNQSLAQGASKQAQSIERSSATLVQIQSATHQNADHARMVAGDMAAGAELAAQAGARLNDALASMREMSGASERISRIIRTIDEIAFQTNILALNAAVEAARAGEAGLGFSVVAGEVRTLAQRSAEAAKDTAALVSGSVESSRVAGARLNDVSELVRVMTARLSAVKQEIDQVDLNGRQQAAGLDQIVRNISQMEQVTAANAAQSEERAAVGDQLLSQAAALREVVESFHALV